MVGAVAVDIVIAVSDRGVLLKSLKQADHWFSLNTVHQ